MSALPTVRRSVLTRRVALWGVLPTAVAAGWLWLLLPPAPRASWPVKGETMFLSRDGRRLATIAMTWIQRQPVPGVLSGGGPPGPDYCDIHVYDVAAGRELAAFHWADVEVRNLAISPDGRRLAAASLWGSGVREWDIDAGQEISTFASTDLPQREAWVHQVSYSPAGELLALVLLGDDGNEHGRRVLWHCEERRIVCELTSKDEFAPNDTIVPGFVLAQGDRKTVKVWRLDTGAMTGVFPWPAEGFRFPSDLTLTSDGKSLLYGNQRSVQLFGADGSRREWPMNADHTPRLSPDQRWLAAFAWHDLRKRSRSVLERLRLATPPQTWAQLTLYDLEDGQERATFPDAKAACFAPDSRTLLVLNENGTLQLWDTPPGPPWSRIGGYAGLVGLIGLVAGRRFKRRRTGNQT